MGRLSDNNLHPWELRAMFRQHGCGPITAAIRAFRFSILDHQVPKAPRNWLERW